MINSRTVTAGLACVAILLMPALTAMGQDVDTAKNKLLAKRAAEADAYRKIAETIKGLHITSDTLVRDFVTENDIIKSELDTFIKGVRLGSPKWYEDLSCEVPAEVTVAKLITQLKEIHSRHYNGSAIKATDFENMKQFIKKDIITVVGMGAPRPDLPPDLPEGVEEVITTVPGLPPTPPIPELLKSDDQTHRSSTGMTDDEAIMLMGKVSPVTKLTSSKSSSHGIIDDVAIDLFRDRQTDNLNYQSEYYTQIDNLQTDTDIILSYQQANPYPVREVKAGATSGIIDDQAIELSKLYFGINPNSPLSYFAMSEGDKQIVVCCSDMIVDNCTCPVTTR